MIVVFQFLVFVVPTLALLCGVSALIAELPVLAEWSRRRRVLVALGCFAIGAISLEIGARIGQLIFP